MQKISSASAPRARRHCNGARSDDHFCASQASVCATNGHESATRVVAAPRHASDAPIGGVPGVPNAAPLYVRRPRRLGGATRRYRGADSALCKKDCGEVDISIRIDSVKRSFTSAVTAARLLDRRQFQGIPLPPGGWLYHGAVPLHWSTRRYKIKIEVPLRAAQNAEL